MMKKTTLDKLGRIVIPIDWRRELMINEDTKLELTFTENKIIIEKRVPTARYAERRLMIA